MNKILNEIISYLKEENIELTIIPNNKRQSSAQAEKDIIRFLQSKNKWEIEDCNLSSNNNTNWTDIKIKSNNVVFHIDIKIISGGQNDNTNCSSAIYYLLTGCENPPTRIDQVIQKLDKNINPDENRDYFFLIIVKDKAGNRIQDCFFISLKNIVGLSPSGSNLPFQCNYTKNTNTNT